LDNGSQIATSGSSQRANYSCQHRSYSGSSSACTASNFSTKPRHKRFANHMQSTLVTYTIHFRYQAEDNTTSKSSATNA
jgi:hypothetical protein